MPKINLLNNSNRLNSNFSNTIKYDESIKDINNKIDNLDNLDNKIDSLIKALDVFSSHLASLDGPLGEAASNLSQRIKSLQ